ncbi:MAG TPA: serine/threonine-protein kinase [Polyangiaceae bacterium]|nr:serine/threonine-protein kinase [Polyangiaceae bacterium]
MSTSETQELRSADIVGSSWQEMDAPDSGDELLGATLNQTYVVERVLGEGGMGRVYLARHTRIAQKRVAVKVLHQKYAGNSQVQARFQREAEAAAAIAHPNVVTVLDIDVTARGLPYLVCEYLEGMDLAEYLRDGRRLEVGAALAIARQLCRGVGAAHERGVVHRDLKPANVFLVGQVGAELPERWLAKILDFGLSRFEADEANPLTKTGLIMGTPSYMAPEQAQGRRADQRADIYGLGAILYRMLTGRAPFDEDSPHATILAVMNSEPARPRSLVPTIPPHLELVLERAMAKDPQQRFADMAAFEQALDAVAAASVPVPSRAPASPARGRQPQRAAGFDAEIQAARPRLLFYSLAAVVLAIAAAALAISGIELATGHRFERVELYLSLLGIIGSSLTPTVLWVLRVRSRIWDNSSRVLAALARLRAAVLGGIVSYGLLLLGFNVLDSFLLRLLERPELRPVDAHWTGWNLLLPAIAFTAAGASSWRRRLLQQPPSWARSVSRACVGGVALAIIAGLLCVGGWWRAKLGAP